MFIQTSEMNVSSVCLIFVKWYWGGFDGLLSSLLVFVAMVHITNGMCAIVDRRPSGGTRVQDMFQSILIFILVGIGNILDTNILTGTPALRTGVILFYLSVEGMILLENAVHLGLPVPEQLRKALEQMRQKRTDGI